ncbi:sensor histidine kinase, partial [uncultured Clostridium sp.]|uniref:sensor histidine kinase n=1 Tax=uncultured Clostridium sp. TaxID=59620 RepID=UPI0025DB8408
NIINKNTKEIISYPYEEITPNLFFNKGLKIINDDKYVWTATEQGLYRYNRETNETINYRENFIEKGITNYKIFDIFQDKSDENILWLAGGKNSGLIKFHKKEGVIKNYLSSSEENSLSYDSINCIQGDDFGNIWIGTEVGLNKFNIETETFTKYYDKDGLVSNYINSVIVDDNGDIWLGTSKGLSKFIINESRFVNFTEMDGLVGSEFNKRASYKLKNGILIFGTTKGVVLFNPNDIEETTIKEENVVLDTLWINKELVVNDSNNIELKHYENNIAIEYFLPNYSRIGTITYLYKMDGINQEWNIGSTDGYAVYNSLKPGNYTFRVKAVNSDGGFTDESIINIVIKKSFWQSDIAYCIYVAFILLIVLYIIYRMKFLNELVAKQTKKIKQQMEENKRLYEKNIRNEKFKNDYFVNLSHELRTPINIILSALQLLNSLEKSDRATKEKNLHYMEIIQKSSNNLLNIINDIIDSSKIESGTYKIDKQESVDIVYLVEETALNMSDYINSKGIDLIIDPEVEELSICCDSKEIARCVVNLIGNAVKFTEEGGKIKVLIKEDNENVSISVEDNGLGISKDDQEFIFKRFQQGRNVNSTQVSSSGIGLTLVKYIVELHGGHVELESELNKGSKFTIVLPIN